MRSALTRARRVRGGDSGFAIVLVALLLVFLLVVAAIVVDLANAREENRQAVASADAAALAGAQALVGGAVMPPGCADNICLTAYHAFQSANINPTNTELSNRSLCTSASGETCYSFQSGRATVQVKNPYIYHGDSANKDNYVNVQICWDTPTSFAQVIGTSKVHVCGSATAKYTPGGGTFVNPVVSDCVTEDNFATEPQDTPLIYVFNSGDYHTEGQQLDFGAKGGQIAKHDEVLVAVFDGHGDSDILLNKIVFMAPTKNSYPSPDSVKLDQFSPNDNKGPLSTNPSPGAPGNKYTVQSLISPIYAADGSLSKGTLAPYTPGGSHLFVIAYKLPDGAHMVSTVAYSASLYVEDGDNVVVNGHPTRCGNANWTFNEAGTLSPNGSSCGENSFFSFTPVPSSGKAVAGKTIVTAFYTDESLLQRADVAVTSAGLPPTPYGIDLSYVPTFGTNPQPVQVKPTLPNNWNTYPLYDGLTSPGGPVTDPTKVPADGGYWLTDSDKNHSSDKFNTTIEWVVPASLVDGTYKIILKAYDTDNNKPGNDCGVFVWNTKVSGGPGNGSVNLVE